MNKRGDIPFWLIMTIIALITFVILVVIMTQAGGKLGGLMDWIRGIL